MSLIHKVHSTQSTQSRNNLIQHRTKPTLFTSKSVSNTVTQDNQRTLSNDYLSTVITVNLAKKKLSVTSHYSWKTVFGVPAYEICVSNAPSNMIILDQSISRYSHRNHSKLLALTLLFPSSTAKPCFCFRNVIKLEFAISQLAIYIRLYSIYKHISIFISILFSYRYLRFTSP